MDHPPAPRPTSLELWTEIAEQYRNRDELKHWKTVVERAIERGENGGRVKWKQALDRELVRIEALIGKLFETHPLD